MKPNKACLVIVCCILFATGSEKESTFDFHDIDETAKNSFRYGFATSALLHALASSSDILTKAEFQKACDRTQKEILKVWAQYLSSADEDQYIGYTNALEIAIEWIEFFEVDDEPIGKCEAFSEDLKSWRKRELNDYYDRRRNENLNQLKLEKSE